MEFVASKLLERENINVNQVKDYGGTALIWTQKYNLKSVINNK